TGAGAALVGASVVAAVVGASVLAAAVVWAAAVGAGAAVVVTPVVVVAFFFAVVGAAVTGCAVVAASVGAAAAVVGSDAMTTLDDTASVVSAVLVVPGRLLDSSRAFTEYPASCGPVAATVSEPDFDPRVPCRASAATVSSPATTSTGSGTRGSGCRRRKT